VERDLADGMISERTATRIYGVVLDEQTGRVDGEATRARRDQVRRDRIARGTPYDEFAAQWSQRKPPEDALKLFGSWPDGAVTEPLMRP
jgi:acetophenone carboxylase